MGWPNLLCLVRHAESQGNVLSVDDRARTPLATHDYALTERGKKQAEITADYLQKNYGDFDSHFVSYYRRAKETMDILAPKARDVFEDPRLAEAQRGIYHTMTKLELESKYPEELMRKDREGLFHYRPWGGENWADVELRIHSFIDTLCRDCDGQNVLIVVHGHWLVLFRRLVEHFSIQQALQMYQNGVSPQPDIDGVAENASVTTYGSRLIIAEGQHFRRSWTELELTKHNVIPWKDKL